MVDVVLRYRTRRPWAPAPASLRRWARLAAGDRPGELGIRVVGSRESRALNARWRGRPKPTNVLSFPAAPELGGRQIGDIVVCAPVVAREAREQGKPLAAHWAHMVVHGTLHLLGFDHERARDAKRMEGRERTLLARIGVADPYGD
jgi:probable rRNA maturation factor